MKQALLTLSNNRKWDLSTPAVMGVINVTPDSFSDGGQFFDQHRAIYQALQQIEEGAGIIDIGGESTRPGAAGVSEAEELRRVIPVIEAIRASSEILISVDTSTPSVMTAAAEAGASLINDVRALTRKGALEAAAVSGLPICLMHMRGEPEVMQKDTRYENLIGDIGHFFAARLDALDAAGISRDKIILDPGFGFGKSPDQNLTLLNRLPEFSVFGCPLLVGVSRKSTIGLILEAEVSDRLIGSVAAAVVAYQKGAAVFRVHDVKATVDALKVARAIAQESVTPTDIT